MSGGTEICHSTFPPNQARNETNELELLVNTELQPHCCRPAHRIVFLEPPIAACNTVPLSFAKSQSYQP